MPIWDVLLDVIVVLTAALLLGIVFERIRQSAVVGYLVAGTLLGPGALNLVRNEVAVKGLAELGVALLLFSIGLEFSWRRLRALGAVALGAGSLQMAATAALVAAVCVAAGMSGDTAVALGLVIAPSSTACVLRILTQRAELDSVHGRGVLGILLLQDAAVVPLVLILTVLGGGGAADQMMSQVLVNLLFALLLVAALYVMTTYVLPHLLDAAVLSRNRELSVLLAIVTCLASSWGAHALGLSPVLGAFVAGILLGGSPYATLIRADVSVLRTVFLTLFFTSIAMLGDVRWIAGHWHLLLAIVPAVVVAKAAVVVLLLRLFQLPPRHAVAAGLCLAQTGEFSFLLAGVGVEGGILSEEAFRVILAMTVTTLFATPYLVAAAPRLGSWVTARWPARMGARAETDQEPASREALRDHVVIVGFGPAGQGVLAALRSSEVPVAIVDLNPRAVAAVKAKGVYAEVGDATHDVVLEHVHVFSARAVVVTVPDQRTVRQVVAMVRMMAPGTRVFARARYHIHAGELAAAGVQIVDEESETGRRLGAEVLRHLGLPRPNEGDA